MTRRFPSRMPRGQAIPGLAALLLLFLGMGSAWAHHGWAEYDENRRMTIAGIVRESDFGNPHATIMLGAADKTWLVILAPPARLESRGVTRDMLAVGASIIVEGLPHRTEANEFRAERLTVDGKTIELR